MGDKTGIGWTDATWNCIRGCTHVSAGCDNCYAASIALRFSGPGRPYEGLAEPGPDGVARFNGRIMLVESHLVDPLRWQRPRMIFVNSMSDLFHVAVPRDYLDRMFAVMALTPRHTFQALTKRPALAARYLGDPLTPRRITCHLGTYANGAKLDHEPVLAALAALASWPLPNVWIGTSVEDNRQRPRINLLKRAPAAVHFLSCEPLIGPLDLRDGDLDHIEWVITGGESGPHHRPYDPAWYRAIRDECLHTGTAYFHKQNGGLTPKSGGRLLDGREWSEFPTAKVTV